MENHQGCKMKFRNQLAVNLVKLIAPVHSYPSSEIDIVDTAFNLADRVLDRIQQDIDANLSKGTSSDAGLNTAINEVREKATAGCSPTTAEKPEERRFFLITDEGLLYPNKDESFEAFINRSLLDLEGK